MALRKDSVLDKEDIIATVRQRMASHFGAEVIERGGHCLYWSGYLTEELKRLGVPCFLQAGTMSWPCVKLDDGKCDSHFSYVWEPSNPVSRHMLETDQLPEMHVWVGLPDTGEVVDLSTRYFSTHMRELLKREWTAPEPPAYLWQNYPPPGVLYEVDRTATLLAHVFWLRAKAKRDGKEVADLGSVIQMLPEMSRDKTQAAIVPRGTIQEQHLHGLISYYLAAHDPLCPSLAGLFEVKTVSLKDGHYRVRAPVKLLPKIQAAVWNVVPMTVRVDLEASDG